MIEVVEQPRDAGIVETHPVDDGLVFPEPEKAGFVVARLRPRRHRADLDVAEADPAEGVHRRARLVEPRGEADPVGKLQTHDLDGRVDGIWSWTRPCQGSQKTQ